MNRKEKIILRAVQSNLPCAKRPYASLARRLGISERFLLLKIKELKKRGYIRRIGAVISAKHLGYKSMLIGVQVENEKVEKIVSFINARDNVSHNYLRDSKYNLWFTFSAKTKKEIHDFVRKLKKTSGINDVSTLPAEKTFKINAEFVF